jgi:hypothetical protein
MYIQYLHHTHFFTISPLPLPPPVPKLQAGPILPSCSLILYRKKRGKKMTFLLV